VSEDDWVITDFYTMWQKTPVWVVPAIERFLEVRTHTKRILVVVMVLVVVVVVMVIMLMM
jgi:hypothetical protein